MSERFICTADNPWTKEKGTPVSHPGAPGAETGGRRLGTAEALQFSDFRKLPEEVRKHFEEIEMFLSDVDGKDLATFTEDSALDEGTIDCENVVRAVNAIAAWVQSSSRQAVLEEAAKEAVDGFDALVGDSKGVYGLHLNGDNAPWEELCKGGRFEEWTAAFEKLRAALAPTPPAEGETK